MGTKTVAALALDGVITYDLACAVQMFRRGPGRTGQPDGFDLVTCGHRPGSVWTPDGFHLNVEHGVDTLEAADIVVVPARAPHDHPPPDDVLNALRGAHQRGAVVLSICLGAFVLAAAGLLDGRPATTHWEYCDDMRRLYPRVELRPDALYVDDGDILTSAGLSAGMDLCLHVVRRELGAAAASDLARWIANLLEGCGSMPALTGPQSALFRFIPRGSLAPPAPRWPRQRPSRPRRTAVRDRATHGSARMRPPGR